MEAPREMSVKDQVKAIAGQWRDREANLIMSSPDPGKIRLCAA